MKIKNILLSSVTAGALACSLTAAAIPITGELRTAGDVIFDTNSLATATAITSYPFQVVTGGDGAFAGLAGNNPNLAAFTFSPNLSPNPVTLWSFVDSGILYEFVMTSVSVAEQNASTLRLNGTGVMTISGGVYDPTDGIWAFSTQSAGGSTSRIFSFSADTEPLPEPSTLAMFGVAMLGVAAAKRRGRAG